MILFIAPNPFKAKKREGFLQRVAAIDEIFAGAKKIYFDDITSVEEQAKLLIKADLIYVHSMYNANKIAGCYEEFGHKIITDLHGVVPEEEEYVDNMEMARIMGATEAIAFRYGKYFVAVSEMMVRHFDAKYPSKLKRSWIVLPVHNASNDGEAVDDVAKKSTTTVIYAGGGQGWQNVDMMVDAINRVNDSSFLILTHDSEAFKNISEDAKDRVAIKSVKSSDVAKYYTAASLGFILRKDTLVNRVACPTKLVEYLRYKVVPIVLTENIGDFKLLGYRYITLKQFLAGRVPAKLIVEYAKENYRVYEKFVKQANEGRKSLLKTEKLIRKKQKAGRNQLNVDSVKTRLDFQAKENMLLRYEYQIEAYQKKVGEYAELADHYRRRYGELESNLKKGKFLHDIIKRVKREK